LDRWTTEFVHDRRDVLPVRPADVFAEIRLLDVQRRPGVAGFLPGQAPRRLVGLLEVRHLGHYRGAWEAQRAQPHETHPDGGDRHPHRDHHRRERASEGSRQASSHRDSGRDRGPEIRARRDTQSKDR
jgi:hypothetical protein